MLQNYSSLNGTEGWIWPPSDGKHATISPPCVEPGPPLDLLLNNILVPPPLRFIGQICYELFSGLLVWDLCEWGSYLEELTNWRRQAGLTFEPHTVGGVWILPPPGNTRYYDQHKGQFARKIVCKRSYCLDTSWHKGDSFWCFRCTVIVFLLINNTQDSTFIQNTESSCSPESFCD